MWRECYLCAMYKASIFLNLIVLVHVANILAYTIYLLGMNTPFTFAYFS